METVIRVTRLNGDELVVNAELIRFVEARPDTVITLTTNDKVLVREGVDEVIRRVIDFARTIRTVPMEPGRPGA